MDVVNEGANFVLQARGRTYDTWYGNRFPLFFWWPKVTVFGRVVVAMSVEEI